MPVLRENLRWGVGRVRDIVGVERELFAAPELSVGDRVRLCARRYGAVMRNSRQLEYLGRDFRYDNRLLPLLLPAYLSEIRRLARVAPFGNRPSLVDVGANVGQFAATFLWRFPAAQVWSFEPNRQIFPLLTENAAGMSAWAVIPWGIAARDAEASLWALEGKSAQGSLFPGNAGIGLRPGALSQQTISLRRLSNDRIGDLNIPPVVDVLKIDVEGAEESALLGVSELRWRFMAIETSLNRDGGLTLDSTLSLCEQIWDARPRIVWSAPVSPGAANADAILAMPDQN